MKFGIDLGTTNSAICKIEKGETKVIKSKPKEKDTMPSCVQFRKNGSLVVGDGAYDAMTNDIAKEAKNGGRNVFSEFKRTMGLDVQDRYRSSFTGRIYTSEELSAEVLKKLKSFVDEEQVDAAVITIPARFQAHQVAATQRAATLAGIECCSLLQEPVAACYAYGLKSEKKDGYWLIFDFGGGTFDVALATVESGKIDIVGTDGDANLGGKNLDYAIVDKIIMPYLKTQFNINNTAESIRQYLKPLAENAKNELSTEKSYTIEVDLIGDIVDDDGEDIQFSLDITQEMIEPVLAPLFQKAIDITKELLAQKNLKGENLSSLILVGGPTRSPLLRKMLREQITPNVDTSIDPMTAVAVGAAIYAATQDVEIGITSQEDEKFAVLSLDYKPQSVLTGAGVTIKLNAEESKGIAGNELMFEIVRGDNGWRSGALPLTENGSRPKCQLQEGRANAFSIVVTDEKGNAVKCYPNEFTILQGTDVANAKLPFYVGIEAYNSELERNVFVPLSGLEKDRPLPAVGTRKGLLVPHSLAPGNSDDKMVIPIYQGEYNSEGKSAIYNSHVFDVEITGDDVPELVPEDSEIDITLKINNSQGYDIDVLFVSLGESFTKSIKIDNQKVMSYDSWLRMFKEAKDRLRSMKRSGNIPAEEFAPVENILNDLDSRKENEHSDPDNMQHILDDLRKAFRKLEDVEASHEWDTLEAELRKGYNDLDKANNDFGNHFDEPVREMHRLVDQAIRSHDVKMAREVKNECRALWVEAAMPGILAAYLHEYDSHFGHYSWNNRMQARQLINRGIEVLNQNEVDEARQIVIQLTNMLPKDEVDNGNLPKLGGQGHE